jgi:hypothetical protein
MQAIYITMFGFIILLGFEIRYRLINDELLSLKKDIARIDKELVELTQEMKLKKIFMRNTSRKK